MKKKTLNQIVGTMLVGGITAGIFYCCDMESNLDRFSNEVRRAAFSSYVQSNSRLQEEIRSLLQEYLRR